MEIPLSIFYFIQLPDRGGATDPPLIPVRLSVPLDVGFTERPRSALKLVDSCLSVRNLRRLAIPGTVDAIQYMEYALSMQQIAIYLLQALM